MTTYRPRKPARAPSAADLAERDAFAALVSTSLPSVRASAEAWRNGLTAFVTLVTTGIVIKGRDTTSALPVGWRVAVTVLLGVGLLLAVLGLWQTLAAQAGTKPQVATLASIHRDHASVAAYEVSLAQGAAQRIRRAQRLVGTALVVLLAGIATTWWAPAAPPTPPAQLSVTHQGGSTCGALQSADGGVIRLKVAGQHEQAAIALGSVSNMKVVAHCG